MSKEERGPFLNQLPETLEEDLKIADRLGVRPLRVGEAEFDTAIDNDVVKWVVTTEGELLVILKFVNGQEISHAVLTRGLPALAAGEASIVGSKELGIYIMTDINNHSGHFLPSSSSLEIGKQAFRDNGVRVPPQVGRTV